MKTFIDGSPIPEGYEEAVHRLVNEICDIEELIPEWELELYSEQQGTASCKPSPDAST